jgi:hypothetical protein
MDKATPEPTQVSPVITPQALLDQLEDLKRTHAESVEIQAESNRRITDGIAQIEETVRALTASHSLPNAAAGVTEKVPRQLTPDEQAKLIATLKARLEEKQAYDRPKGIDFAKVQKALERDPSGMWSLAQMEKTGGEPGLVAVEDGAYIFADCSAESPAGRRNCVYDKKAEKRAAPGFTGNADDMADEFGVDLWTEDFFRRMQEIGKFDAHSSSWLQTPVETRKRNYGLTGEYDESCAGNLPPEPHVFGAYAFDPSPARGWRGMLRIRKA